MNKTNRIARFLNNLIDNYSRTKKNLGHIAALKASACFVIDFITRYKYMLYIKTMRKYIYMIFEDKIADYGNYMFSPKGNEFSEKIPVWVCWLQGIDKMPEIVKICYKNMQNKFPDFTEIKLVTMDNYNDYVSMPNYVLEKLNKGYISLTNFSDILRFMLLQEYGGLWIDSTVYVSNQVPQKVFQQPFYSQKTNDSFFKIRYVSESRWASWLMFVRPHSPIFDYCTPLLLYYVKNFDCFIDYYLIDYLIDLAYSNNQYVRQLIDCLEINNEGAFLLNEVINNEFNKEKFEQIKKDTLFNKLDWHRNLQGLTVDNKITYYEYLKSINN